MNTLLGHSLPRSTKHLRYAAFCVAAFALTAGPTVRAVTEPSALTGEKKNYAYSWQQEVQEGADADKEITQQMGLYDNPDVQAYVDAVGRRVLQASTFASASTPEMYRNTKFTFRVLDSSVVNAFALPGGYVYVTRGLLSHVDNEAQLAVVLGHEIGHVAARHSSQQARRSQWSQLGVIAGAILGQAVLGDRMPNLAQNVLKTGGQAMQVFMLRYSREAENEADTLGVGYALNAGYAAGESARFFDALKRLSAQEGQGIPSWMSSHPDPGNRANHVLQLASERRPGAPAQLVVGTDEYLQHVNGMIVGDDPRQGFTQNGVFYHPTLHFQLPVAQGWKVDNQPNAVVFADPNGRAVMGLRLASANRTHDAASQFVTDNKVQVTASGDTAINGLPTTVIVGHAAGEQQNQQLGVWDAFIEYEGKVYSLLGYAPAQSFDQVRPTFEQVASGFSPLRDPRLANVQPARLRVVRADHAAPFATFVPTSLPPNFNPESVAIMNQVALNENVPSGAELKLPDLTAAPTGQPAIATADNPAQPAATVPPQPPPGSVNYPTPQSAPPANPVPGAPYPGSSYPSTGGTPTASYPSQPSAYPPQGYPQTSYPGGTTTYPSQTSPYPTQPPVGAPTGDSNYPTPGTPYPSQQFPPQQQPGGAYPPPSYPPAQNPYPTGSYPAPQYPNAPTGSYPAPAQPGYPQFPQPGNAPPQTPQQSTPPPNWPR